MSLYLQISGHKPRHAGSGLPILTAYLPKGKLNILITDIDLLYLRKGRERSKDTLAVILLADIGCIPR